MASAGTPLGIPALATLQPRRLLVWRAGALGDTLTLFPLLSALRQCYPTAVLHAVGTPPNLELARQAGLVDGVWDAGAPLFAPLFLDPHTAQSGRPTAPPALATGPQVFAGPLPDPHTGQRGPSSAAPALAAWLQGIDLALVWSGAAATIAGNLRHLGLPLVLAAPPFPPPGQRVGIASYLLECLVPLGLAGAPSPLMSTDSGRQGGRDHSTPGLAGAASPLVPLLKPTQEALQATQAAWQAALAASAPPTGVSPAAPAAGAPWPIVQAAPGAGSSAPPPVVLHAGAGSPAKRWPLPSFLALATLLQAAGWSVLWTCGPADGAVRQALLGAGIAPASILAGWSLPHLCALLARCAAVVAADSGIAHLSASLGLSTVVIFGPTDERVWVPLGPRVAVLRAAPCARREPPWGSLPASAVCPAQPCCLPALTPQRVAHALNQLCASL